MPHLLKSVERYKEARRVLFGDVVPEHTQFKVLFQPIEFVSVDRGAIDSVVVGDRMRVGILDWSDVEARSLALNEDPKYLGPFRVNQPDQSKKTLQRRLSPSCSVGQSRRGSSSRTMTCIARQGAGLAR